ncbi:MAG: Iron-sulfur protein [Dehalococcoidia bacterium]|nr:Iron-sulfur protein [Dehalococcoidia bacterium]
MPRREISRREFLQSFVGRRQPVPHVDQEHCYTNMGCSLCSTACPVGALTGNKTALSLDSDKCTGCGICVSVCPWQALRLPPFNTSEIEAELGALLSQAEALPITVVFTCRCSHTGWRSMMSPLPVPPGTGSTPHPSRNHEQLSLWAQEGRARSAS